MHEKRAQKALLQSKLHELAAVPEIFSGKAAYSSAPAGGSQPPAPAPKKAIKKLGGGGGFLAGLVRAVVLDAQ